MKIAALRPAQSECKSVSLVGKRLGGFLRSLITVITALFSPAGRYLWNARKARIFRKKGVLPMTTTVTAAAVSKNFGAYQDAAVRDPVIITKNGRPRTVLLAYEDFVRLSKRDRRVELTAELSAHEIAAVEAAEMEPGLDHLNDELLPAKGLTAKNAAG